VKTGADRLLLVTPLETASDVCTIRCDGRVFTIERSVLRPAVRGRDVSPFTASPSRMVLWPCDAAGRMRPSLPPGAVRWLATYERALTRRADYRGGPPWTVFRTAAGVAANRVVWPDLARACAAVALDVVAPDAIPLNTCYVAAAPDEDTALAVAATLNSTWIRVLVRACADEARGDYRRHNARVMAEVPVPASPVAVSRLARLSYQGHLQHDVHQRDLDQAVAAALDLPRALQADLAALADDLG
jgi:hypothetical protein